MFYVASKILGFFAAPSNALAFTAALGLLLLFTRAARPGRAIALISVAGLLACGLGPVGNALIAPLEARFPAPPAGASPGGIIVLGGGVEDRISAFTGGVELNEAGNRLHALVALARRFPQARLVYTGGTGEFLNASRVPEAEIVRRHIADLGLDPTRVVFESRSRNTAENAALTAGLLGPSEAGGVDWWLVTSAYHMPRAVGCFRAAGFKVAAYPVDRRTAGLRDLGRPFATMGEGLRRTDLAFKEWLGLLAYRASGRIGALLPAP